jgi:hypothetical protein
MLAVGRTYGDEAQICMAESGGVGDLLYGHSALGREAIETGVLDRLHVTLMTCDDVLDYLDNPKELARLKKKDILTAEMVRAAVPMDEIHPDPVGLLSKLTEIIGSGPPP